MLGTSGWGQRKQPKAARRSARCYVVGFSKVVRRTEPQQTARHEICKGRIPGMVVLGVQGEALRRQILTLLPDVMGIFPGLDEKDGATACLSLPEMLNTREASR
jgi:hypothetical protein